MPHRGKSAVKQCTVRKTRKHSKKERERKGCQKNIQNLKRSMVKYWDRESKYA